jgi:hypothetical protein
MHNKENKKKNELHTDGKRIPKCRFAFVTAASTLYVRSQTLLRLKLLSLKILVMSRVLRAAMQFRKNWFYPPSAWSMYKSSKRGAET